MASRTGWFQRPRRFQCQRCRMPASPTSWAAAIARPTVSARSHGTYFGEVRPGCGRVQAICDFVHGHIHFDYMQARSTRTGLEAFHERIGVCRDFAHLAVTLCRCLNIPARYINGHLGDIGVPVVDPMDFSAWIEVFLDGSWWTFDPRNNIPRIGRIVVARGRDAADIPLINSFGPHVLKSFRVWTYEVFDPC